MQAGPLVAAAAAVAAAVIYFLKSSTSRTRQSDRKRYLELCDLVASLRTPPPLMLVDLDAFDRNAREVAQKVHQTNPGATIRLGTKSVRVIELLKRAVRIGDDVSPGIYRGMLCYSVQEAALLHENGLNDLVVAYPTVSPTDISKACEIVAAGGNLTLMVDSVHHVEVLEKQCASFGFKHKLPVCIDLDTSWRPLGGVIHLGAQRSPCRTPQQCLHLAQTIAQTKLLKLVGLMGYEAHVAFGSGLLHARIFDLFQSKMCQPALFFALTVTRKPQPDIITCQSGGFIASGSTGPDKSPVAHIPAELKPLDGEGFGEVQTPLSCRACPFPLHVGDPIFFRSAKSGEIAEHFTEYVAFRRTGGKLEVVGQWPTYRGLGQVFY